MNEIAEEVEEFSSVEDLEEEERETWYQASPGCDEASEETTRRCEGGTAIDDEFSEEKLQRSKITYIRSGKVQEALALVPITL